MASVEFTQSTLTVASVKRRVILTKSEWWYLPKYP